MHHLHIKASASAPPRPRARQTSQTQQHEETRAVVCGRQGTRRGRGGFESPTVRDAAPLAWAWAWAWRGSFVRSDGNGAERVKTVDRSSRTRAGGRWGRDRHRPRFLSGFPPPWHRFSTWAGLAGAGALPPCRWTLCEKYLGDGVRRPEGSSLHAFLPCFPTPNSLPNPHGAMPWKWHHDILLP